MADTAVAADAPAPATRAKKPTHPKTSEMVDSAIEGLKERSGSTVQAIKKYIAAQYKVDAEKLAPAINKYLKSCVESGALIRTVVKRASGSIKLESSAATKKPAAKSSAKANKAAAAAASPAKPSAAAAASPAKPSAAARDKKAPAAKKKPAAKKPSTTAKGESTAAPKAKKTAKLLTKKPKASKPKKAAATPKSKPVAKKAAAKT